jgi:hypothetical protein
MSTSGSDSNKPSQTPDETPRSLDTAPRSGQGVAGKALPYLAALAAATAAAAAPPAAASPVPEQDRAYLEALLQGSWTQPADLNAAKPADDQAAAPKADDFKTAQGFNDSNNPHPQPYSDQHYADSGHFGDRN